MRELNGPDKFFSAIGRFLYEFSQLEFSLKCTVASAVGLKYEHSESIMMHDFALLCTIAQSILMPTVSKPAKLKDLIGKCRSLNDDRVRIVHRVWHIWTKGGGWLQHVSRQKSRWSRVEPLR